MRWLTCVMWLLLGTVSSGRASAQLDPVFDGVWEGTINVVTSYGIRQIPKWLEPEAPRRLRIFLDGDVVYVSIGNRLASRERLIVDKLDAAAVIHKQVLNGNVIEIWQISLTKTEEDVVLAYLWKVVNSTDGLADWEGARFAWAAVGELRRTRRGHRR